MLFYLHPFENTSKFFIHVGVYDIVTHLHLPLSLLSLKMMAYMLFIHHIAEIMLICLGNV